MDKTEVHGYVNLRDDAGYGHNVDLDAELQKANSGIAQAQASSNQKTVQSPSY